VSPIDPSALASWRSWIGRQDTCTQLLDVTTLRRFAAAIGTNLTVERHWPALGHWAYFQPVLPTQELGPDGHTKRGGFFPPVTLPRRMFASAEIEWIEPLVINTIATARSLIAAVHHRTGRTGELVIVDVDRTIEQSGRICVRERQAIVYGQAGTPIPAITCASAAAENIWRPDPVELFRFSAATSNGHRIHYDYPYATQIEGYPALVVQGPLIAARLLGYAMANNPSPASRYRFRAVAPCFVSQPITFTPGERPGQLRAVRCDGVVAMEADAEFSMKITSASEL